MWDRLRSHLDGALSREVAQATNTALVQAGFSLVNGLALLAGTSVVAVSVAAGSASVGDLVLFTLAATAVQRAVFSAMNTYAIAAPALGMFATYSDYQDDPSIQGQVECQPLRHSIEFEDVWFTYQATRNRR